MHENRFVNKALLQIFEARPYTLALSWLWECPALTLFHALGIFSCYETRCLSSSRSSLCSEGHFGMFGAVLSRILFLCTCSLQQDCHYYMWGQGENYSGGQWGPWEEVGGFGLASPNKSQGWRGDCVRGFGSARDSPCLAPGKEAY